MAVITNWHSIQSIAIRLCMNTIPLRQKQVLPQKSEEDRYTWLKDSICDGNTLWRWYILGLYDSNLDTTSIVMALQRMGLSIWREQKAEVWIAMPIRRHYRPHLTEIFVRDLIERRADLAKYSAFWRVYSSASSPSISANRCLSSRPAQRSWRTRFLTKKIPLSLSKKKNPVEFFTTVCYCTMTVSSYIHQSIRLLFSIERLRRSQAMAP